MDEIRPFSEGISAGDNQQDLGYKDIFATSFMNFNKQLNLSQAQRVLNAVREGKFKVGWKVGEEYFIDKGLFRKAQRVITEHNIELLKSLLPSDRFEVQRIKRLLSVKFPEGKMSASSAKSIAKLTAKEIAKKKGITLSPKLLGKWLVKILPWVGWGIVIGDLVARGMKELGTDNKSESNAIPYGENYHRDVGWY